ncbi:MAG: O-antigen ligase family protein [Chlamydiota bacterium]
MCRGGRFIEAARVAAAALLGALLLVRLLWTGVTYPESDAFIALAALALLAALLAVSSLGNGGWRLRAGADGCVLLYFLVILALSLATSRRWLAQGVLFQTAACTAAYLVAANVSVSRRARNALCAALIAGALAVSLYGLYQHFQGLAETRAAFEGALRGCDMGSAFMGRLLSRAIFSTFFYPNALAGFLVVAIPFTASVCWFRKTDALSAATAGYLSLLAASSAAWAFFPELAGKPLLLAGLFAAVTALAAGLGIAEKREGGMLRTLCIFPIAILPLWALALTASEGAWLSLCAACVLAPLLFAGRFRAAWIIVLAFAVLCVGAWCSGSIPAGLMDSLGARADYWRAALGMWRAHPLAGMGPGTFAGAYPAFRLPGSEEGRMAHSAYLGLAAETGVAGLAAFLCMAVAWLVALRSGEGRQEPLCAAVFVSLCAFLLHDAADVGLVVPGTTFTVWLLAGIGAGAASPPKEWKKLSPSAGIALAALVIAGAAWIAVPHARAEAHRLSAGRYSDSGRAGEARAEIEKAIAIEGDNPDYWMLLARARAREEGDARALDSYARAAALGAGIPSYHFSYAICLWRLCGAGREPRGAAAAISELSRAIRCNPHDPDYRLLMGDLLEKTGQGGASLIEYRRGLALIETAQRKPRRIRRHSPESLERLRAMTAEKIRDLERDLRGGKDRQ